MKEGVQVRAVIILCRGVAVHSDSNDTADQNTPTLSAFLLLDSVHLSPPLSSRSLLVCCT